MIHQIKTRNNIFKFHSVGSGEPIIFIAGFGSSKMVWDNTIKILKKHFQVIYFDNRGIGDNAQLISPASTQLMAKDVIKIIKHMKYENVCIVGHSLGSYVAQWVASMIPVAVRKLILISSRAESSINSMLHYKALLDLITAGIDRSILVADSLAWLYGKKYLKNAMNIKKLIKNQLKIPPIASVKNLSNQIKALMNHHSSKYLDKIISKTMIINGDEDIVTTPKEAILLHRKIKNSKLIILKDVGHVLPIENPSGLSKMIYDFIF